MFVVVDEYMTLSRLLVCQLFVKQLLVINMLVQKSTIMTIAVVTDIVSNNKLEIYTSIREEPSEFQGILRSNAYRTWFPHCS